MFLDSLAHVRFIDTLFLDNRVLQDEILILVIVMIRKTPVLLYSQVVLYLIIDVLVVVA